MTDCLSLDGTASRVSQLLREKDEKRAQERRRHLLYLIVAFLEEQGYINSLESLLKEAQLSKEFQVCDNIDLETIILEYADHYYAKFNKYPKFCRKIESSVSGGLGNSLGSRKERNLKKQGKQEDNKSTDESGLGKGKALPKTTNELNFQMTVTPIFPAECGDRASRRPFAESIDNERILKPIKGLYPPGSEWREIAETISKEIVSKDLNVRWDDIKGYDDCKANLKEAIIYPLKYPTLFNGKFSPFRGILLYGPPGTGKTMLAKAVATECRCTFFNITSSSIVSKWRGDSEKYIRVLLDLAYYFAPTIIFIDEIDWIATKGESSSTSDPARRFRAELLARLDGLLSVENSNVMILAATNLPWNIDAALLRRLEKRIFVGLPDKHTRLQILMFYVDRELYDTEDLLQLLDETEEYSCADLKLLCKEAWMAQMGLFWKRLENNKLRVDEVEKEASCITHIRHLESTLNFVKPTVKHMTKDYIEWQKNLVLK